MQPLLALAPVLLILVLMIVLRWSAAAAGLAGLAAALVVALGPFGYGRALTAEGVFSPCDPGAEQRGHPRGASLRAASTPG